MSARLIVLTTWALASTVLAPAQAGASAPARAAAQAAAPPAVTLTSPAEGGLIVGGQPTFAGTAGADPPDATSVSVAVYAGGSVSGAPVQTLTAPVAAGGGYSIEPSASLADGLYTAQTSQSSTSGTGTSGAVGFRIDNAPAALELDPPAAEPLLDPSPTLAGFAGTASGDGATVTLIVYPGSSADATPVGFPSGPLASNGGFAIQLPPTLADGLYTIVAAQTVPGGYGFSDPIQVELKATAPQVTITGPAAGASVAGGSVRFAGTASAGYGNSGAIELSLYAGAGIGGRPLGALTAVRRGMSWSASWPKRLTLGIYTVHAEQRDIVGRVAAVSATFLDVPPAAVIGTAIQISQDGVVTVPVQCPLAGAQTCTGDASVVTEHALRTSARGPRARLRILSAHFSIPAGRAAVITGQVPARVLRALRRLGAQPVSVTVALAAGAAGRQVYSGLRTVQVGA